MESDTEHSIDLIVNDKSSIVQGVFDVSQLDTLSDEEIYEKFDAIEKNLVESFGTSEAPVCHQFTDGLYSREIFMPKHRFVTSKIHRFEHQYCILSGEVLVWTKFDGVMRIVGPYVGVTKPNTKRLLYIIEDTRWVTFHPTRKTTVEEVEEEIIISRENKQLTGLLQ